MATPHVPDRIRVERLGDELLVLDAHRGLLHRIAAIDVRAIAAGHAAAYEADLAPEVLAAVVEALAAPADARRWDRRQVLTSSAVLAGAGVTTLLLPTAAVAASIGITPEATLYSNSIAEMTSTDLRSFTRQGTAVFGLNQPAYGHWEVPVGVTRVQVVATTTSGTVAHNRKPSPYAQPPGRGVRAVATFAVTPGSILVARFSGSATWGETGGGSGGGAIGVAGNSSGSYEWLLVAGGGGGGGNAGININIANPPYGTGTYVGGAGGDAGTGGSASNGQNGTKGGVVTATGGAGATTTTAGAGGTGVQFSNVASSGGSPTGPAFSAGSSLLGIGGLTANSADGNVGGCGGCGLYGGGAGAGAGLDEAGAGGGGGSSFIRTNRTVAGTSRTIETFTRDYSMGPTLTVYY